MYIKTKKAYRQRKKATQPTDPIVIQIKQTEKTQKNTRLVGYNIMLHGAPHDDNDDLPCQIFSNNSKMYTILQSNRLVLTWRQNSFQLSLCQRPGFQKVDQYLLAANGFIRYLQVCLGILVTEATKWYLWATSGSIITRRTGRSSTNSASELAPQIITMRTVTFGTGNLLACLATFWNWYWSTISTLIGGVCRFGLPTAMAGLSLQVVQKTEIQANKSTNRQLSHDIKSLYNH